MGNWSKSAKKIWAKSSRPPRAANFLSRQFSAKNGAILKSFIIFWQRYCTHTHLLVEVQCTHTQKRSEGQRLVLLQNEQDLVRGHGFLSAVAATQFEFLHHCMVGDTGRRKVEYKMSHKSRTLSGPSNRLRKWTWPTRRKTPRPTSASRRPPWSQSSGGQPTGQLRLRVTFWRFLTSSPGFWKKKKDAFKDDATAACFCLDGIVTFFCLMGWLTALEPGNRVS